MKNKAKRALLLIYSESCMKRRRSLFIHLSYIRILAKKFAIVILFLTAFALMLLNKTESVILEKTSSAAADVISPVVDLLVVPARLIAGVYDYFGEIKEVYKDNQDLRAENKKLLNLYDKMKVLEVENKLLSHLLNYEVPPEAEFITARIIAEEGDAFSHSVIAYTGGSDKVKKGQVVLSDRGVVGRVDKLGNMYSKILLITDINSRIPVMVEKNRVRGILAGDNTSWPKMVFIPLDAEINVGDRIVTSGVAGVFPSGLPVGRIASVEKNQVIVKPYSNLDNLEYVRIVDYGLEGIISNE